MVERTGQGWEVLQDGHRVRSSAIGVRNPIYAISTAHGARTVPEPAISGVATDPIGDSIRLDIPFCA